MKRMRILFGLWAAALCSCQLDSAWSPETQVVIDIDADEAVRARTTSVEVQIAGSKDQDSLVNAESSLDERVPVGGSDDKPWPLRFVVKPRSNDDTRLFLVTVTARDADDAFVAQVRGATGYVSGEVRQLRLQLSEACLDVMRCEGLQTCADGECVDAWQEPRTLPVFQTLVDAGTPETRRDAGADTTPPDSGANEDDAGGIITGNPSEDPCTVDHGGCDALVSCQMVLGIVVCGSCPQGYDDVHSDGTECHDRDECQDKSAVCDAKFGVCANTPGGYDCHCKSGYHGDGKHCSANVPCENDAACGGNAGCQTLDGLKVCVCKSGFEGDGASCDDIDECGRHIDMCRANSACKNKPGGFDCSCLPGYLDDNAACKDKDECSSAADNDCDTEPAACVNDPGGFHCACPKGYSGDGKGAMGCHDIDECAMNTDNCASTPDACANDVGSFHCRCPMGFAGDGVGDAGCKDVDECAAGSDNCDHTPNACVNDVGSFHCKCPVGYLGEGRGDMGCIYNNECMLGTDNCDHSPNACMDDLDGFHCTCPDGYTGNGRGDQGCVDINECSMRMSDCDTTPDACVNTTGGYRCECPQGYTGNGRGNNGCMDVDECANRMDGCDQSPRACVNDPGGFHCQCPSGYMGSGQGDSGCVDVNECAAQSDDCDNSPDACVNDTPGFHCKCPDGYSGDGRGNSGCTDTDECMNNHGGCDSARECVNTPGGFHCGSCRDGYGTSGMTGCSMCMCYQTGGDHACTSTSSSLPAASARDLPTAAAQAASTLFGFQTILPANSRVTGFGAFKKPGTSPGYRMGLYTDDGGKPGRRVSRTARVAFADASLTLPAQNDSADCLPGGSYWVIGLADDALTLGQDGGQGAVPSVSLMTDLRDLPDTWPGGGGANSVSPLSMYVTIDHP
jgi:hypothetical protein